jgi:hypothetical protein
MDAHKLWIFAHIMLLVYWLGADLGVFILARRAKNAALAFETRLKLLEAAMAIDLLPRVCFALMVPVGATLAATAGIIGLPLPALAVVWAYGVVWSALTVLATRWEGTPRGALWRKANLGMQGLLGAVFIAVAVASLVGAGPIDSPWLAQKLFLFGLIYPAAIMIDVAFQPGVKAFAAIAAEGSTERREKAFSKSVDATCFWVLIVYFLVALTAFWGVMQPG